MRNPHAGNEWSGPFSDADEESWGAHPEALEACGHEVTLTLTPNLTPTLTATPTLTPTLAQALALTLTLTLTLHPNPSP